MYCVRNIFFLESDRPANVKEASFVADNKSIVFRCGERVDAADELRNILRLSDITKPGTFRCTFASNVKTADIIFTSVYKTTKAWKTIDNTVFEDKAYPNFALYAEAISLCGNSKTECIVIEDTTVGIKAIKEIVRDKKGHVLAIEIIPPGYESGRVPAIMASIQDIVYFSELLEMYTDFDSWYGLISYMQKKGITPPQDDSFVAKSKYLKLCSTACLRVDNEYVHAKQNPLRFTNVL